MTIHWDQLAWLAISQVWQVAVAALIVAVVVRLWCRHRPHLAYLLWMLVLVKCLTPPIWSSPVGVFSWAQAKVEVYDEVAPLSGPIVTDTVVLADTSPLVEDEFTSDTTRSKKHTLNGEPAPSKRLAGKERPSWKIGWSTIVGLIWIGGSAVVLLTAVARLLACALIVRCSESLDDEKVAASLSKLARQLGIRRRVRLLVTKRNVGPAVFGLFRPTVLLPQTLANGKSPTELEPILAHELIHFRRGDTQFGWFQVAAQIMWWFHPLVWWASRQATTERERCCDEEAIRNLACAPEDYAQSLIDVLNQKRQLQPLYALPGVRVFEITVRRLEHIMQRSDQFSRRTPRWQWAVCLMIALLLLPGAGFVIEWGKAREKEPGERFPAPNKSKSGEWNQFGGGSHRNNTPDGENVPTVWDHNTGKNVRWSAQLGSSTYNTPVIADSKVFIGTNNQAGYIKEHPPKVDLSCLLCFDERSGKFLWQYSIEKLKHENSKLTKRVFDWPMLGLCSVAMVESKRLWVVTTRCEVVCLDTDGFRDKENDGPFKDEKLKSEKDADVIWKYSMLDLLGIHPHNLSNCSVTCAGDVLLVGTSNGVDEAHSKIPAPHAPSFIALDRNTGKLLWKSKLPGENILHGQWSSPAYGVIDGVPQVIFAGGDGWLYAFDWRDLRGGETNLLWWFDCNPKQSKWELGGRGTRNNILSTPVIYDGLVYLAIGQNIEHGEGDGLLWCIDPTKRGDISAELVFNEQDPKTPIPHKRFQACEVDKGDYVRPNPNSGVVWKYDKSDQNGDGKLEFEETMHRSVSTPTIKNGLLVIPDTSGLVHCVDAKTGRVYWVHDQLAGCYGSPLIVDGKIYLGDEDGDVSILKLSKKLKLMDEIAMDYSISGSLVFAGNSLYIPTQKRLHSIMAPAREREKATTERRMPEARPKEVAKKSDWLKSLQVKWRFENEIGFETSPAVWNAAVFASDPDGFLYAIDTTTGLLKWRYQTDSSFTSSLTVAHGRVYVGDFEGRLYCFHADVGKAIWIFRTGAEIFGGVAIWEDRAIFGTQDGSLYCVEEKTGRLLWKFQAPDQIRSTPTVVEDNVIVSCCDSNLYILSAKTGKLVDKFDLGSQTKSSPKVWDGHVFVGTEEGVLFNIDLKTVKATWQFEPMSGGHAIRGSAAITDDFVLYASLDKRVYAVDRKSGALQWAYVGKGRFESSPIVVGQHVIIGGGDGRVCVLQLKTGKKVWDFELGGSIMDAAAIGERTVYIGSDAGKLYAFESDEME